MPEMRAKLSPGSFLMSLPWHLVAPTHCTLLCMLVGVFSWGLQFAARQLCAYLLKPLDLGKWESARV